MPDVSVPFRLTAFAAPSRVSGTGRAYAADRPSGDWPPGGDKKSPWWWLLSSIMSSSSCTLPTSSDTPSYMAGRQGCVRAVGKGFAGRRALEFAAWLLWWHFALILLDHLCCSELPKYALHVLLLNMAAMLGAVLERLSTGLLALAYLAMWDGYSRRGLVTDTCVGIM